MAAFCCFDINGQDWRQKEKLGSDVAQSGLSLKTETTSDASTKRSNKLALALLLSATQLIDAFYD
jgi:hypothetical protein